MPRRERSASGRIGVLCAPSGRSGTRLAARPPRAAAATASHSRPSTSRPWTSSTGVAVAAAVAVADRSPLLAAAIFIVVPPSGLPRPVHLRTVCTQHTYSQYVCKAVSTPSHPGRARDATRAALDRRRAPAVRRARLRRRRDRGDRPRGGRDARRPLPPLRRQGRALPRGLRGRRGRDCRSGSARASSAGARRPARGARRGVDEMLDACVDPGFAADRPDRRAGRARLAAMARGRLALRDGLADGELPAGGRGRRDRAAAGAPARPRAARRARRGRDVRRAGRRPGWRAP